MKASTPPATHPDYYDGLMDWPLYGPRDGEISDLVLSLASHGIRLGDIEDEIKERLRAWLEDVERNQ